MLGLNNHLREDKLDNMLYIVRPWSIRTVKEFDGLMVKSHKFVLFKDESLRVLEMDITELRKLKKFFDDWVDPFAMDNPEHSDNMK